MNYIHLFDEAFDAAEKAAQRIRSKGEASQPLTQGAFGDLTYRIDKEVEDAIIKVIKRRLPNSFIVSEESGYLGDPESELLVLIDPIDGSTNASRSVPFYSSAITIVEGHRFGDVAAAAVVDVIQGERIVSTGGGKVMVGGVVSSPSSAKPFDNAYININLRSDLQPTDERWLNAMLRVTKYPRFLGSAALETAYVAIGRSDAFVQISPNLRSFDCIGSLFLVQEAGGWFNCLNTDIDDTDLRGSERFSYVAACDERMGRMIMSLNH